MNNKLMTHSEWLRANPEVLLREKIEDLGLQIEGLKIDKYNLQGEIESLDIECSMLASENKNMANFLENHANEEGNLYDYNDVNNIAKTGRL
jgi:hypothetical protein